MVQVVSGCLFFIINFTAAHQRLAGFRTHSPPSATRRACASSKSVSTRARHCTSGSNSSPALPPSRDSTARVLGVRMAMPF